VDAVLAPGGDLPDLPVPQVALLSGPAGIVPSNAQAAGGITVSAAVSSSPSQERLVRIALMIRDAERALPGRERRGREAALIRLPFRRPTRGVAAAFPERHGNDVDLAS
jgi:hypothetical protein